MKDSKERTDDYSDDNGSRTENDFKKLKRPMHASKRSRTPERLRGMHRRRRKRIDW